MIEWLQALLPSIGVLWLFVLALRAVIHADRRERDAVTRHEARSASGAGGTAASADPTAERTARSAGPPAAGARPGPPAD